MIGLANPSLPACVGCGDECSVQELDDSGNCICCASDVQAAIDAERAADFQSLSAEWFELRDHRQSAKYLEWIDTQASDKALAERAA